MWLNLFRNRFLRIATFMKAREMELYTLPRSSQVWAKWLLPAFVSWIIFSLTFMCSKKSLDSRHSYFCTGLYKYLSAKINAENIWYRLEKYACPPCLVETLIWAPWCLSTLPFLVWCILPIYAIFWKHFLTCWSFSEIASKLGTFERQCLS